MGVIKAVYNRLRPFTPRKIGVVDGYPIRWPRLFDATDTFPDLEAEARELLTYAIQPADHVVILGGGFGVTMIHAATLVGREGHVDVFEASPDVCDTLRDTLALNGFTERVSIRPCAVTETTLKLYGDEPIETIHPRELPECDVLEIDIEGAELAVLDGLEIQPRELIVEYHEQYGVIESHVEHRFRRDGYERQRHLSGSEGIYNVWASRSP